jgi:hypothetical protein
MTVSPFSSRRNVRKRRGLALGRLVFVSVCLVGTPGFEPGAYSSWECASLSAESRDSDGPTLRPRVDRRRTGVAVESLCQPNTQCFARTDTDKDTASRAQAIHPSLVRVACLRVRIPASRPHKPSRNPIPRNLTLDVAERFARGLPRRMAPPIAPSPPGFPVLVLSTRRRRLGSRSTPVCNLRSRFSVANGGVLT